MNELKEKIIERLNNVQSVLKESGQVKLLEDFSSLGFNLNSINFLSSIISRCHSKVWGDIYIKETPTFLDEYKKAGIEEWYWWGWFLGALKNECEKLSQLLLNSLQFDDRVVNSEQFNLSFTKNSYAKVVLQEDENLETTQNQKETFKNLRLCDKHNFSTQIEDVLFKLGFTKNTLTLCEIVIDKTNKNEFNIILKDEKDNNVVVSVVDFCVVKVNDKTIATKEENKLGFSFILQNSFEIEKDKDFLYKIKNGDFSFAVEQKENFEFEQDFRTLVNKYKQDILKDNKKIIRTSKYETINQLFVDKTLTKSEDGLWEIVYFFDIAPTTIATITIKQNKQNPKETFFVETFINSIRHKQD